MSEEAFGTSKHTEGTELCGNLQKLRGSAAELRGDVTFPVSPLVPSQSFHFPGFSAKSGILVFQGSTKERRRRHSCNNPLLGFSCCLLALLRTSLVTSSLPISHRGNQAMKKNNYKEEGGGRRGGLGYFFCLVWDSYSFETVLHNLWKI